jgi:ketosteroid isomerase-like protein
MTAVIDTRKRTADRISEYNALFAPKRLQEWSLLFQPHCRFEVAYPLPPMPAVLEGRDQLLGAIGGLADAVGEVRIDNEKLHHTLNPEIVISEHRLRVQLLNGDLYQNRYISIIELRDGLIAAVKEFYDSRAHARFLTALGVVTG